MNDGLKYFALTFSIVMIIHGSYSIGTTFDEKIITEQGSMIVYPVEREQVLQTSFLPEGHYEEYKHPITICNSLEDCDRMCGTGKFFNYGTHTCDWDL